MAASKELQLAIKIGGKVEKSLSGALGTVSKGISGLATSMAAATAAAAGAIGGVVTAAISVGKEFESAMSQVQATMLLDTSTEEGQAAYAALEEAARECGRSTAFSATEAAEALNYLALAGYDSAEAAEALPTILTLAGAGAMDLATASDMVTDAMSALQMEVNETNLSTFADQLAMTASQANTSVEQLGEGILTIGATAANLAGGTTELNTALGILADNGIKGSEGGTHLRNVILSLQSPTDKAAEAMDALGISVYDAEGNMNELQTIFQQLQAATEGWNQAEIDDLMGTIFNKTDLASAGALLANCTDRWDELSASIENSSGAAEAMYAIQLDNLEGDLAILQSGLTDLGISIYQELNAPLREMTQLAGDMVGELAAAFEEGGLEGMVGALGDVMAEAINVISEYIPTVVSMAVDLISAFISGISENSGALAEMGSEVLTIFLDGIFEIVPEVLLAGIDIILELASGLASQIPELASNGTEAITNFVGGIIERIPEIAETALTVIDALADGLIDNIPQIITSGILLIASLIMGLQSMIPGLLQTGLNLIVGLAQGIFANLPLLLQMGVQVITNMVAGISAMLPDLISSGIQLIIYLIQGIIANLPAIIEAAVQIVAALVMGLMGAVPMLGQGVLDLITAIVECFINTDWIALGGQIIDSIISGITGAISGVGSIITGSLDKIFGGGEADVSDQGVAATESYAAGIESSASIVSGAASSLTSSAFTGMDYSSVTEAGVAGSEAFTGGLTTSLEDFTFDTSLIGLDSAELITNLTTTAEEGGLAFTGALDTSISDFTFDTSAIGIDIETLSSNMDLAGLTGGEAFTTSLEDTVAMLEIDTSQIPVDTSGFIGTMNTTGTEGVDAILEGMEAGSGAVASAAADLASSINESLDAGWNTARSAAASAMNSLTSTVQAGAKSAASAVKSAFENMTIRIPRPKLPVITTTYKTETYGEGGSVKIPSFSVHWNAAGGILGQAAILNTTQGLQGVGEAGPEAILPLDTLWEKMRSILDDTLKQKGSESLAEELLRRLRDAGENEGGGQRGNGSPAAAGTGGIMVTYSPVYNITGASRDDVVAAARISQAEWDKHMKEWERDRGRKCF